uniref:Transmembrane protein 176A n=1 Tax=Balaenoptera musculus TaxID=9771 RepID=A0A8C0DER4_BALMU
MTPLKAGPRCCTVTGGLASSRGICANLLPTLPPDAPFLPPRRVSTGLGMAGGGEVAAGAPQPTCIKVHIRQESALAKLLLSGCSPACPRPTRAPSLPGLGRIVLGVLSGVLGGVLFIFYYTTLPGSGAPIWTGAVAVLAGAVAFIYEKRGGTYWALLRTLLALAAFSTATAAIIIGARSFHEYHHVFFHSICDVSPSWGPTRAPSSPSADMGRLKLCTSYVNMLKALFISINAMLLGVWALLLLASLVPLCLLCLCVWGSRAFQGRQEWRADGLGRRKVSLQ